MEIRNHSRDCGHPEAVYWNDLHVWSCRRVDCLGGQKVEENVFREVVEWSSEPFCPACGERIDFCQGHGPVGDPIGHQTLRFHDDDIHFECHENSECHPRESAPDIDGPGVLNAHSTDDLLRELALRNNKKNDDGVLFSRIQVKWVGCLGGVSYLHDNSDLWMGAKFGVANIEVMIDGEFRDRHWDGS